MEKEIERIVELEKRVAYLEQRLNLFLKLNQSKLDIHKFTFGLQPI